MKRSTLYVKAVVDIMHLSKCGPSPRLCLWFLKPACSIYLCLPVDPSVPAFLLLSPKLKANELTSTHTALPKEFLSTSSTRYFPIHFC